MKHIKKISQFIRPHIKWTLLSPIFVLVEVGAELIQPDLMAKIVNQGVIGGDTSVIFSLGLKMLLYSLFGMVGGILSIYAAGYVSFNFGTDLRNAVFRKITHFTQEERALWKDGSLITRMTNDIYKIQSVIQASMRLLFRAPLTFFGAIIMVLYLNADISSVLLILLPILLFAIYLPLKRAYPFFRKTQEYKDSLFSFLLEYLSGIKVVKSYNQEANEKIRFSENNNKIIDSCLMASKWIVLIGPLMTFLLNIGIAAVVYWGAIMVEDREINVGGIMAITNYLTQILISLLMAQRVLLSISESAPSVDRVGEVLCHENRSENMGAYRSFPNGNCDIEFNGVSFRYPNAPTDKFILKDVSFLLKNGETLGVIGEIGSGKSTLIALLLRFCETTEGVIRIGGNEIKEYSQESLRQNIRVAMQDATLFSGTIAENILQGKPNASHTELEEITEKMLLKEFIDSTPSGYNYRVEQGGKNLSGGQRQRISLARTLIGKSEILILDDCLNAVDLKTEMLLLKEINKIPATKIIISQRINSIRNAHQILVMEHGEVVGIGTHESLLKENSTYREIYQSQTDDYMSDSNKEP